MFYIYSQCTRKEEFSAYARSNWELNLGCGGGQRVVGQKCAPSDVLLGLASAALLRLPDSVWMWKMWKMWNKVENMFEQERRETNIVGTVFTKSCFRYEQNRERMFNLYQLHQSSWTSWHSSSPLRHLSTSYWTWWKSWGPGVATSREGGHLGSIMFHPIKETC